MSELKTVDFISLFIFIFIYFHIFGLRVRSQHNVTYHSYTKQEIQDEEREVEKSEEKTKKFVFPKFDQWIYIFEKKASERMLTKKEEKCVNL